MVLPPPAYNDDPNSFAYATVRERWPSILERAIEDIDAYTSDHPTTFECGESVKHKIAALLQDFRSDAIVHSFTANELKLKPELNEYNSHLAEFNLKKEVTWRTGPWLFLECYLYQLLSLWFSQTEKLANFDVFESLKNLSFEKSSSGVAELCKRYEALSKDLVRHADDLEAKKILFKEFIDISLWGNATDLSLLSGNVTLEDIKGLQGAEVRKKNEEKIVVNDTDQVWEHYSASPKKRVDIVLDNSGFELFADLCLSLFLLDSNLTQKVVVHCKKIPWFVSDTMPKDFYEILKQLEDPSFFQEIHQNQSEADSVAFLASKLETYINNDQLVAQTHDFWTSPSNFWEIAKEKDLFSELQKSNLIIFKGDLNYRKLTGDLDWAKTTAFTTAIQSLANSGLPVLSLRTCKADVVVGLPEGLNEKLIEEYKAAGNEKGQFWTASGKWAVISFSSGIPK